MNINTSVCMCVYVWVYCIGVCLSIFLFVCGCKRICACLLYLCVCMSQHLWFCSEGWKWSKDVELLEDSYDSVICYSFRIQITELLHIVCQEKD